MISCTTQSWCCAEVAAVKLLSCVSNRVTGDVLSIEGKLCATIGQFMLYSTQESKRTACFFRLNENLEFELELPNSVPSKSTMS